MANAIRWVVRIWSVWWRQGVFFWMLEICGVGEEADYFQFERATYVTSAWSRGTRILGRTWCVDEYIYISAKTIFNPWSDSYTGNNPVILSFYLCNRTFLSFSSLAGLHGGWRKCKLATTAQIKWQVVEPHELLQRPLYTSKIWWCLSWDFMSDETWLRCISVCGNIYSVNRV